MFDVWMDLKEFDLWMATILNNIKPYSTARIAIINRLFNSTALFVVYKWPLTIEDVVTKWNEIKLKCLKFCSLNIVGFFARLQTKVDLQLKRFSKVRLGPAFPFLRPLTCPAFQVFWGHDFPIFLRPY